jgi:hypothetical protein
MLWSASKIKTYITLWPWNNIDCNSTKSLVQFWSFSSPMDWTLKYCLHLIHIA